MSGGVGTEKKCHARVGGKEGHNWPYPVADSAGHPAFFSLSQADIF